MGLFHTFLGMEKIAVFSWCVPLALLSPSISPSLRTQTLVIIPRSQIPRPRNVISDIYQRFCSNTHTLITGTAVNTHRSAWWADYAVHTVLGSLTLITRQPPWCCPRLCPGGPWCLYRLWWSRKCGDCDVCSTDGIWRGIGYRHQGSVKHKWGKTMMMPFICSYRNKNEPTAIHPSFGEYLPANKDVGSQSPVLEFGGPC